MGNLFLRCIGFIPSAAFELLQLYFARAISWTPASAGVTGGNRRGLLKSMPVSVKLIPRFSGSYAALRRGQL